MLYDRGMYTAVTRDIEVQVYPLYQAEQSDPHEGRFVWSYTVRIANNGPETVQLVSRSWTITTGAGRVIEVNGPGVVGEQPILKPGEAFQYTSGTPLDTPTGFMVGRYQMMAEDGEGFDVEIPLFSLDSPHYMPRPN